VLYLDADVLVLDGIRALIDADLQGMPFGAVQDPINPTFGTGKALPGWRRLGIAAQRAYFNSGVLLLDLPAVDRDGVVDRALRMVARHPELLRLWDQDALNAAADDRWCRLPRRWNAAPISALRRTPWVRLEEGHAVPVAELEAAESAAAVLHFLSPAKPWLDKFPDGAVNDLYRRHLAAVSAADGLDQRPTGAVT
jgi:lipopolysaccharide biosynthesis glycosyltransferase